MYMKSCLAQCLKDSKYLKRNVQYILIFKIAELHIHIASRVSKPQLICRFITNYLLQTILLSSPSLTLTLPQYKH